MNPAVPTSDGYLVAGGRGVDALRRTLGTITADPSRVWCAVADDDEHAATIGHATPIRLAAWTGQRAAVRALLDRTPIADDTTVQILTAGASAEPAAFTHLHAGDGAVIPSQHRWPLRTRAGVRRLQHAQVPASSGVTMRAGALRALAERGWLDGTPITIAELEELAGPVSCTRAADPSGPSEPAAALPAPRPTPLSVTLLIPAYNEAGCIGDTIRSALAQTRPPDEILVVDDGSSDTTGEIARTLGARVYRTTGTGSKGAAINAGMQVVTTDAIVLVDADTVLHPRAIEHLVADLDAGYDATHGAVLPANDRGIWARGRTLEYAAAIRYYKRIQQTLDRILVLSGCILAVRTSALRAAGGFRSRTMVEDLDLTWTMHHLGLRIGYSPAAIAYPIEPVNWAQYKAQMRRWTRGFFQAIGVHATSLHRTKSLALLVVATLWDVITTPLIGIVLLLAATVTTVPAPLVSTYLGWTAVWTGLAVAVAATVIGIRPAVRAAPSALVLGVCNGYFYLEAFTVEWILRRRLSTWVKGH